MLISNRAYCGVESLMRLAQFHEDRPCTAQRLARSIKRSISYTEALLAGLRNAGLVQARRGYHGGYYLSRSPERITVGEIVQALDELSAPRDKFGGDGSPSEADELRGTQLLWRALRSYVVLFLHGISLADIMPDGDSSAAFRRNRDSSISSSISPVRH